MKTVRVAGYTNQTTSKNFTNKMSDPPPPLKMKKKSLDVYKIGGAVNNHYASFNIKE